MALFLMIKKELVWVLFFFAVLLVGTVHAEEAEDVSVAYDCLAENVVGQCSSLNLEEQIFSSLAVGECTEEIEEKFGGNCWSEGSCSVKETSLAILAMDKTSFDTENASEWLLTQRKVPSGIEWFLQIDAEGSYSCSIESESGTGSVSFGSDKKISSLSGSCFSEDPDGYWLEISSSCLDDEFTISCGEYFSSNLLFKEQGGDVVFVTSETSSASESDFTTEKINSLCFTDGNFCDYESSLWAVFALADSDYRNEVSYTLPYLISGAGSNSEFIPEAFLYYLTEAERYSSDLFARQNSRGYWSASGDRIYDTAFALLPFQGDSLSEKTKAKEWFLGDEVQDDDGCWDNNVKNTGFVLYSLWPEYGPSITCYEKSDCLDTQDCVLGECVDRECNSDDNCLGGQICSQAGYCIGSSGDECSVDDPDSCPSGEFCFEGYCVECVNDSDCTTGFCSTNNECVLTGEDDCEDAGFFCRGEFACGTDGGEVLDDYFCYGPKKCCDVAPEENSCSDLNGVICDIGETCTNGESITTASDVGSGEVCCVDGFCEASRVDFSECEDAGGTCRREGCLSSEESSDKFCEDLADYCCLSGGGSSSSSSGGGGEKSYLWVWILGILIVLVVLGILYKDKLRLFFLRFGKGKPSDFKGPRRPGFPPPTSRIPLRRFGQRKVMPPRRPSGARPQPSKPQKKTDNELDDVLKKLRDMGK